MSGELMKTGERVALADVVKHNYGVARAGIEMQKAKVLADFEAAIAHQWDAAELFIQELVAEGEAIAERANRRIKERFNASGLPKEWAPAAIFYVSSRGENAIKSRRDELRKVAQTRAEEQSKAAKLELDRREAELLTQLMTTALTSEAALAFLDKVPALDELMPPLEMELPGPPVAAIKALLGHKAAVSEKRAAAGRTGGRASAKAKQIASQGEQTGVGVVSVPSAGLQVIDLLPETGGLLAGGEAQQ